MPSQFVTTGPGQAFIGQQGSYSFLGYSESGWNLSFMGFYEPVKADYSAGTSADMQYMGEEAQIDGVLSRFDPLVLKIIEQRTVGEGAAVAGSFASNALGTLMVSEGYTFDLVIVCPYAGKSTMTNTPSCWHFYLAYLDASYSIPVGSRATKPSISFHALPLHNSNNLSGILYDNILPSLPDPA